MRRRSSRFEAEAPGWSPCVRNPAATKQSIGPAAQPLESGGGVDLPDGLERPVSLFVE